MKEREESYFQCTSKHTQFTDFRNVTSNIFCLYYDDISILENYTSNATYFTIILKPKQTGLKNRQPLY